MKFSIEEMKKGIPLKRAGWSGYWKYNERIDDISMFCETGEIIRFSETDQLLFTLENVLADDWEVATAENCIVLRDQRQAYKRMESAMLAS